MNRDKEYTIFTEGTYHTHLSRDEMIRYHHHLMEDKEVHRIEKHLVDCQLCSEALVGVAEMEDAVKFYHVTRDLHKRARRRNLLKRNLFSQLDLISIMAVMLLIAFIIIITFLYFSKYHQ